MVRQYSRLVCADNTGVKEVSIITVLGVGHRPTGFVGDRIVATVKKAVPNSQIPKGTVVKAVIVRTKYPIRREDGSYIRFDDNACVILDEEGNPKDTRVFGPVAREIRKKGYVKIASLAPEVL